MNVKKLILYLVLSFLIFSIYQLFSTLTIDEIWNYGFSYNIAKGAIPYRDFNMVILPLYSIIMYIPLKLFSNNLFCFKLFNAFVFAIIIYISTNKNAFISLIIYMYILSCNPFCSYNTFICVILMFILYYEKSNFKYKNEVIGILLGCILATKQNIGILLFIPYILHSKKKIKSIIYYLIPITLICIYLIFNNALFECIDYCFLGLSNFKENFRVFSYIFLLFTILICCYLIFKYIKTKDISYIYLFCFQFLVFPILDFYHFYVAIIPVIYYILITKNININLILILISLPISILYFGIRLNDINIQNNGIYKYTNVPKFGINYMKNVKSFFIKNKEKRVFIFTSNAYVTKIYMNQKLDKYDLINKGNMGKDENKYIREIDNICKTKKCIFIINKKEFNKNSQLNPIIKQYVLKNYKYCGSEPVDYYCN